MSPAPRGDGETHELVAHVLHMFSQPMTALQCSLEFALNTLDDSEQCRAWIEAALENSERLRCRLSLAREMTEVADACGFEETVPLRSLLEEVLSEIGPLFDDEGPTPQVCCEEVEVCGERSRLLRAFAHLLQLLKPSAIAAPCTSEIRAERRTELMEVRFLRFVLRHNLSKDQVASRLEIAKEIFESAGGGLIFSCFAGNDAMVRVFLRTPKAQLDLYNETVRAKPVASTIGTTAVFPQVS